MRPRAWSSCLRCSGFLALTYTVVSSAFGQVYFLKFDFFMWILLRHKQDRLGANCRFSTFGIGRWSLRMTTRGVLCTFLGAAAAVAAVKRSDREIYHLFDLFVSSLTLLPMLYARLVCFKHCGQNCFEVVFWSQKKSRNVLTYYGDWNADGSQAKLL